MQPPPPDPRAIFEHALGGKVPAVSGVGAGALDQPGLGDAVACLVRQLRPLLEIDDEIDRDTSLSRPARIGRGGAVADEIAGHQGPPVAASRSVSEGAML